MLIIELTGVPGCGKSTLWELLKSELQKRGRTVYTYRELMHREPLFVHKGLLFQWEKWNPQTVSCMNWIEQYCALVPQDEKRDRFKKMFIELYHRVHVAAWNRGEDMILLDEGLVQNVTSLFFMDAIPKDPSAERVLKHLIHVKGRYLFVKCNISMEENIARLKKRARENDRYYALEEDRLREALLVKEQNIDYLLFLIETEKRGEKIDIDMEKSTKHNVDLIIEKLITRAGS